MRVHRYYYFDKLKKKFNTIFALNILLYYDDLS